MSWATGVLVAVLAGWGLSACADDPPATSGTTDRSVDASPDRSGTDQGEALPCVPGVEPFTGPAADEFGADRVMAAYCGIVEFTLDHAFTSLVAPGPERTARDYAFVREHLSPPARRRWDAAVRRYVADADARSFRTVNGLTLHDVADVPDGYLIPPAGPYAYGTRTGPAAAAVGRDGALTLRLRITTGIVLEEEGDDSGRHSLLPLTRRVSYALVPDDADGWLIDDWRSTDETGDVRIVTGG